MIPAWQVRGSAAAMDRALRAGLTRPQLLALTLARAARRRGDPVDPTEPALRAALANPASAVFDETEAHRLRRQRRGTA